MRIRLVVSVSIAAVATLAFSAGAAATGTSPGSAPPTAKVFRPVGGGGQRALAAPQLSAANLSYNGGNVLTAPSIFLIYWGPEWASGFSTGGYSSLAAQTYVNSFFGVVGGSSWLNSTTQYCQNIAAGQQFCAGQAGAQFVTNPLGQLAGI